MSRCALLLLVLLSFPSGSRASDFWDEVRSPGSRAHAVLLREVAVALRREEGPHALELLTRVAEPFRRDADTLVMHGLALGLVVRLDEAIQAFTAALVANPTVLDDPQWGTRAALIAARAERFAFASDVLSRVIGNMPSLPARRELFALLGDMLLTQGPDHVERAIVAYREALRGAGTVDSRSLLGLALALQRHNEPAAAREVSARITAASRHEVVVGTLPLPDAEKAARLAIAAEALNDTEAATTHWQTVAAQAGPWQSHAVAEVARLQKPKAQRARGAKP